MSNWNKEHSQFYQYIINWLINNNLLINKNRLKADTFSHHITTYRFPSYLGNVTSHGRLLRISKTTQT